MDISLKYAHELDKQDPLASYRERFVIDDPHLIYLDGNSLGRLPIATASFAKELISQQWGERLIRAWGEGLWTRPQEIGAKIAKLIGAQADEVIVSDSTSINLYKLALSALKKQKGRHHILTDDLNFPSDIYIFQGIAELLGKQHQLQILPSPDGLSGPVDAIKEALNNEEVALLSLSHTVFKSGYTYDMPAITSQAHQADALVLWDLSHSVGAMPIHLNDANVDLAIGCTYKYLNAGPGAPAFLYVRRDLQQALGNPITGWWGQKEPFEFDLKYSPDESLQRFQSGTLPMISLSLIEPGVDMLIEADIEHVRDKSIKQTEYLIALWESVLEPLGFTLNSPREAAQRGSHISLGHKEGWRINQCMIQEMNIIPDFRAPDNIRLGIAPLYTRFEDIHEAVSRIKRIVADNLFEKYPAARTKVT